VEDVTGEEAEFARELLASQVLSAAQLRTALEYQSALGGSLRAILLKLGFVSEDRLNEFIAQREQLPTIDVSERPLDTELMKRIPREIIERHQALPFRLTDQSVLLVVSEPMALQASEEIRFVTGCKVELALAPRSQIQARISRHFASRAAEPDVPPPSLESQLLAQVADPAVAALARALLKRGVISAQEWQLER
jgi:hypothetical protein